MQKYNFIEKAESVVCVWVRELVVGFDSPKVGDQKAEVGGPGFESRKRSQFHEVQNQVRPADLERSGKLRSKFISASFNKDPELDRSER